MGGVRRDFRHTFWSFSCLYFKTATKPYKPNSRGGGDISDFGVSYGFCSIKKLATNNVFFFFVKMSLVGISLAPVIFTNRRHIDGIAFAAVFKYKSFILVFIVFLWVFHVS
jgi:hypothetical protein